MAAAAGVATVAAHAPIEPFFKPCEMCGVHTTLRVIIGDKVAALCTPHVQAAVPHMRARGLNTITFTK